MVRALDHLVLPTRDLPALAATFRDLGFQVGSRNRHPWGTENHIIQFDGNFLELIGLAPDYVPLSEADEAYPFAHFVGSYLDRRSEGLAMAVLRSSDAVKDAAAFQRAGIGQGRMLPFSRATRAPDGSEKVVAFTVAFAEAATLPEVGFFVCEQHRPENFWNPAFQVHPGQITRLKGFVLVAAHPEDHLPFLTAFADAAPPRAISGGFEVALENGHIEILTPDGFISAYDGSRAMPGGEPRIGAILLEIEARTDGVNRFFEQPSEASDFILVGEPTRRPAVIDAQP